MSVVFGFTIAVMLILLTYMGYRFSVRRRLVLLLPLCLELAALTVAVLAFAGNVLTTNLMEAGLVFFGIGLPGTVFVCDYVKMMRKIKEHGIYEGFVEPAPGRDSEIEKILDSDKKYINPIIKENQVHEIMSDLSFNKDDILKNIKKSLVQAQTYMNGGKCGKALEIYDALIKIIRNCPGLFYNHGNASYCTDKYPDAVRSYKRALELNEKIIRETLSQKEAPPLPEDGKTGADGADAGYPAEADIRRGESEAHYNLGNTYFKLGKFEQAVDSYKKALEINPVLEDAAENIARSLIALNRINDAVCWYKSIVEGDTGNFRSHYAIGLLYFDIENYDEALASLKESIRLNPSFGEAYEALGKVYSKTGRHTDAAESYKKLMRLTPGDYIGYYNLGTSYYKAEEKEKAVEAFKRAIELKPDSYKGYYNMAVALDELNRQEEAIEAFKKVIALKPDFVDAYNNLGIILSTRDRCHEALDVYAEGLKRNPEEYSLYYNMGITLYDMGKFAEAAAAYKSALELKPNEHEINYHLGVTLMELKKYNEAVNAFKGALKAKPSDSEILYNLAVVYSLNKKADIAVDTLKRAVESDGALKEEAKSDRAFDNIRNREEFRELVS